MPQQCLGLDNHQRGFQLVAYQGEGLYPVREGHRGPQRQGEQHRSEDDYNSASICFAHVARCSCRIRKSAGQVPMQPDSDRRTR